MQGDRRIEAAERRMAERVIEVGGDPSAPAEPEAAARPEEAVRPEPAAAAPAGPPQEVDDAAPGMPSAARLPQSIDPAVPADEAMEVGADEGSIEVEGA